jgi:hypothetical protein
MTTLKEVLSRKLLVSTAALAISLALGWLSTEPSIAEKELEGIARKYRLAKPVELTLPSTRAPKQVRNVHPSLERISAWISGEGASAALADLDGDGLPNDLCLVDPRTDQVWILPIPGTGERYERFELGPEPLRYDPGTMAPTGCMFGDLNEDGWTDVVVYYWGRTPVAFLQIPSGEGGVSKPSRASFISTELVNSEERWFTNSATMADFDGDGHVDLLFANYFPDGSDILNPNGTGNEVLHDTKSRSFNGGRKHFLLWKGATEGSTPIVSFVDETPFEDQTIDRGWTLAVGAADLDGDGLPEIYLANDFGPDRLLHNQSRKGSLAFTVLEGQRGFFTPKSAVLGHDSFKGMGVDFGDINGDGLLDIYVSNITGPFALQESHMLWLNTGDTVGLKNGIAPFVQASEKFGLSRSGWAWDAKFADLNNDGVPEVLQATGFIKGTVNRWPELQALATSNDELISNPRFWPSFRPGDDVSGTQPNPLFAQAPNGRYYDISHELELDEPYNTRGIAIADVDGDGALDFVYANQWEPSVYIKNKCSSCGSFIGLRLLRQASSDVGGSGIICEIQGRPAGIHLPAAIGATVSVTTSDGRRFVEQVDGGNGHSGRRSPEIHIGLGDAPVEGPLDVLIRWRSFSGEMHSATIRLNPGWHTVILGS